jgi:hypothetical protein
MAFETNKEFSWWNFWVCFVVALGAFGFSFPFSLIGSTLALPNFLIYMKLLDVTSVPPALASNFDALLGAISGVCRPYQDAHHGADFTCPRYLRLGLLSTYSLSHGYQTNTVESGLYIGLHYYRSLAELSPVDLEMLQCSLSADCLWELGAGATWSSVSLDSGFGQTYH